ncbi:MAG: hypothetical protein JXA60_08425 [Candidatus Coatesbacteria bacterium]|nr:hypothetical protein [Candidatus Coatesbacteria bacterium]
MTYKSIKARLDSLDKRKRLDEPSWQKEIPIKGENEYRKMICSKCKKEYDCKLNIYVRLREARNSINSIKGINITLDDSYLCPLCNKNAGNKLPLVKISIKYVDREEPVASMITLDHVLLITDFLNGKQIWKYESAYAGTRNNVDMKYLSRDLRKILLGESSEK